MDMIFKALNDPARRALLDALRLRDGQSLTELEAVLSMSRFGVMKHLAVLEGAHLIVTHRSGRFKYHYLNAAPMQEMMDRWVAPFLQVQARALIDMKQQLERETDMGKPDFMMQTFIRCTQDALWAALTRADQMAAYHFFCRKVTGDAVVGENVDFLRPDGSVMLRQTTTALDPKARIAMTFEPLYMDPPGATTHMVYLIEPQGDACKLTIEHYDLPTGETGITEGWARLAASLKSWLETGAALRAAA